jgi:hypothetical protein
MSLDGAPAQHPQSSLSSPWFGLVWCCGVLYAGVYTCPHACSSVRGAGSDVWGQRKPFCLRAVCLCAVLRHTCLCAVLRHTCLCTVLRHTCLCTVLRHTCLCAVLRHTCLCAVLRHTCLCTVLRHTCLCTVRLARVAVQPSARECPTPNAAILAPFPVAKHVVPPHHTKWLSVRSNQSFTRAQLRWASGGNRLRTLSRQPCDSMWCTCAAPRFV